MHRSGTSLVTRMLNLCGVYLGRPEEIMPPSGDNPDGYWENLKFVEINEGVLHGFGGDWDCPPEIPEDWVSRVERSGLSTRASSLIAEFAGHEPWGWKDPRSTITQFFWRTLLPDTKVVVCVRNPLEVALSIYHRDHHSPSFGMTLWREYNERVLADVPPHLRLITHFDAYFERCETELRRVLSFAGLEATSEAIQQCVALARPERRHSRHRTAELAHEAIPPRVLDLYVALCREAGWREVDRDGSFVDHVAQGPTLADATIRSQPAQVVSDEITVLRQRIGRLEQEQSALRSRCDSAIRELQVRLAAIQGQF
jgi:hypothetical protein